MNLENESKRHVGTNGRGLRNALDWDQRKQAWKSKMGFKTGARKLGYEARPDTIQMQNSRAHCTLKLWSFRMVAGGGFWCSNMSTNMFNLLSDFSFSSVMAELTASDARSMSQRNPAAKSSNSSVFSPRPRPPKRKILCLQNVFEDIATEVLLLCDRIHP